MLSILLATILFLIFILLGSFHFYWFFGGGWGLEKVIPTNEKKLNIQTIPKVATLIVAIVLISFGLMYVNKTGLINLIIPDWITVYGYWAVPFIFILRAIGDFNYVGFFRRIKHTEFAKADAQLFTPLCLFIGVIGIVIQLMS
ncbi:DUF3995 domain-containing protein [Zobellia uliginosa]|uniref:DUF3995 domain-containing protein n=1 Tax=Zobellia uliginosa TaxID=143224 RepID=UPI001C077B0E|nr:DUF3995 domain-containing protein [Zobellia uliginosa]MBU2946556.1 DUF3995 domain-containing protein [Zobellia uliginosa]